MAEIKFPTRENLEQSAKSDVRAELEGSNPFLRNHWLGAMVIAFAFLFFDFYEKLKEILRQFFFDTAENPYLNRWSSIWKIKTKAATGAQGNIVAEGVLGSPIPISSILTVGGFQYRTTLGATLNAQSINIVSATWTAGIVTIQTSGNHGVATGISVTITDMIPLGYNGIFIATITGDDTLTYELESDPGVVTILGFSKSTTAIIPVQADSTVTPPVVGVDTNQDSGAALTFTPPLAGVNNTAYVDPDGLSGGADQEVSEDQRLRFLDRVQNPVANFNVAAIIQKALEVPGNTRIFVYENTPAVGDVTVYFTRDNDGIIPTSGDVTRTKEKLLEIKPANTPSDIPDVGLIVKAPGPKVINFDFATGAGFINPDTSTMRQAINNSLDVFFQEKTAPGRDIEEPEYLSAIQNTRDIETGELLISFKLGTGGPSGQISVNPTEIPTKGTVSFP